VKARSVTEIDPGPLADLFQHVAQAAIALQSGAQPSIVIRLAAREKPDALDHAFGQPHAATVESQARDFNTIACPRCQRACVAIEWHGRKAREARAMKKPQVVDMLPRTLVRLSGLEPETYGLKVRCSTN
jgi:hypothetical protein